VVSRQLWDRYNRLKHQVMRLEEELSKGERYDGRPIPTDEERRAALARGRFLMPAFTPLRNRLRRP
jgi:hypothetical protein